MRHLSMNRSSQRLFFHHFSIRNHFLFYSWWKIVTFNIIKLISFINQSTFFDIDLTQKLILSTWQFRDFVQIDHKHIANLISKFHQTVTVITVIHSTFVESANFTIVRTTRNSFESIDFSSKWIVNTIKAFEKTINQFYHDTEKYKLSQFYRNFVFKIFEQESSSFIDHFSSNRRIEDRHTFTTSNKRISVEVSVSKIARFRDEFDFNVFLVRIKKRYDVDIVRKKLDSAFNFSFFIESEKDNFNQLIDFNSEQFFNQSIETFDVDEIFVNQSKTFISFDSVSTKQRRTRVTSDTFAKKVIYNRFVKSEVKTYTMSNLTKKNIQRICEKTITNYV